MDINAAFGLDFTRHHVVCSELADLLKVPKERRDEFIRYVFEFEDTLSPQDPIMPICTEKGNPVLKRAEHHLRGFLDALGDTNDREWEMIGLASLRHGRGDIYIRVGSQLRPGGHCKEYRRAGIVSEIIRPIADGLADLIGRDPQEPKAKDWRLNSILRDIRTWPDRFGAVGITDHRSTTLAKAVGLLHEILPGIIPDSVSPSTIRDIWNPRPRKRNVRNK